MSDEPELTNTSNILEKLSANSPAGSPQWQQELYAIIHKIVTGTFSQSIPAKLQSVISCDELSQMTAQKVMDACVPIGKQTVVMPEFVRVVAQRVLIDLTRHYLAKVRTPASGFANINPTSSLNLLNELKADDKTASQLAMSNEFWPTITAHLGENDRELLQLRYIEELTSPEIAAIFGVTPGTVRSQLTRLHAMLREQLKSNPYFESRL